MTVQMRVRSVARRLGWPGLLVMSFVITWFCFGTNIRYELVGKRDRTLSHPGQADQLALLHAKLHLQRGIAYNKQGQSGLALQQFNQAVALAPEFAAAYQLRGWTYFYQGRHAQAITDFDQALGLAPGDWLAYYGRGLAHWERGQWQPAIQDFNQALTLDWVITASNSFAGQPAPTKADLFFYRGSALIFQGQKTRGIADLNQTIALEPAYSKAYWVRALAYIDLNEWLKAEHDFIRLFDLAPATPDRAIDYFTGLIQKDVTNLTAYYFRAIAYGFQHHYKAAIADLTQVITLDAGIALAFFWRGKLHLFSGLEALAQSDLQEAVRLGLPVLLLEEAENLLAQMSPGNLCSSVSGR